MNTKPTLSTVHQGVFTFAGNDKRLVWEGIGVVCAAIACGLRLSVASDISVYEVDKHHEFQWVVLAVSLLVPSLVWLVFRFLHEVTRRSNTTESSLATLAQAGWVAIAAYVVSSMLLLPLVAPPPDDLMPVPNLLGLALTFLGLAIEGPLGNPPQNENNDIDKKRSVGALVPRLAIGIGLTVAGVVLEPLALLPVVIATSVSLFRQGSTKSHIAGMPRLVANALIVAFCTLCVIAAPLAFAATSDTSFGAFLLVRVIVGLVVGVLFGLRWPRSSRSPIWNGYMATGSWILCLVLSIMVSRSFPDTFLSNAAPQRNPMTLFAGEADQQVHGKMQAPSRRTPMSGRAGRDFSGNIMQGVEDIENTSFLWEEVGDEFRVRREPVIARDFSVSEAVTERNIAEELRSVFAVLVPLQYRGSDEPDGTTWWIYPGYMSAWISEPAPLTLIFGALALCVLLGFTAVISPGIVIATVLLGPGLAVALVATGYYLQTGGQFSILALAQNWTILTLHLLIGYCVLNLAFFLTTSPVIRVVGLVVSACFGGAVVLLLVPTPRLSGSSKLFEDAAATYAATMVKAIPPGAIVISADSLEARIVLDAARRADSTRFKLLLLTLSGRIEEWSISTGRQVRTSDNIDILTLPGYAPDTVGLIEIPRERPDTSGSVSRLRMSQLAWRLKLRGLAPADSSNRMAFGQGLISMVVGRLAYNTFGETDFWLLPSAQAMNLDGLESYLEHHGFIARLADRPFYTFAGRHHALGSSDLYAPLSRQIEDLSSVSAKVNPSGRGAGQIFTPLVTSCLDFAESALLDHQDSAACIRVLMFVSDTVRRSVFPFGIEQEGRLFRLWRSVGHKQRAERVLFSLYEKWDRVKAQGLERGDALGLANLASEVFLNAELAGDERTALMILDDMRRLIAPGTAADTLRMARIEEVRLRNALASGAEPASVLRATRDRYASSQSPAFKKLVEFAERALTLLARADSQQVSGAAPGSGQRPGSEVEAR